MMITNTINKFLNLIHTKCYDMRRNCYKEEPIYWLFYDFRQNFPQFKADNTHTNITIEQYA